MRNSKNYGLSVLVEQWWLSIYVGRFRFSLYLSLFINYLQELFPVAIVRPNWQVGFGLIVSNTMGGRPLRGEN